MISLMDYAYVWSSRPLEDCIDPSTLILGVTRSLFMWNTKAGEASGEELEPDDPLIGREEKPEKVCDEKKRS
jgi:hypothetical protein